MLLALRIPMHTRRKGQAKLDMCVSLCLFPVMMSYSPDFDGFEGSANIVYEASVPIHMIPALKLSLWKCCVKSESVFGGDSQDTEGARHDGAGRRLKDYGSQHQLPEQAQSL
jgi:hypothetical protein